jgi:putative hemolysin
MTLAPMIRPATRPKGFATRPMAHAREFTNPPAGVDILTVGDQMNALYQVGFAVSPRAIEAALRLRFEVFNVELGEGLMTSRETGMDRDAFDDQMTHIVLLERATGAVVGTYRLQEAAVARRAAGIYSEQEYDLAAFEEFLPFCVETGRACIAKAHRSMGAVILLWKGIASYLEATNARWLFGCCSITTLDPDDGWRAMRTLRAQGCMHPVLCVPAREAFTCGHPRLEHCDSIRGTVKLPKLFSAYMRLGAHVISEPAIDREFGTVDFLVLLDAAKVRMSTFSTTALMAKLIPGLAV